MTDNLKCITNGLLQRQSKMYNRNHLILNARFLEILTFGSSNNANPNR